VARAGSHQPQLPDKIAAAARLSKPSQSARSTRTSYAPALASQLHSNVYDRLSRSPTLQHTLHYAYHHVCVASGDAPPPLLRRLVSRQVHGECEENMGCEAQIAGVQHTAREVFSRSAQKRFAYEISPSRDGIPTASICSNFRRLNLDLSRFGLTLCRVIDLETNHCGILRGGVRLNDPRLKGSDGGGEATIVLMYILYPHLKVVREKRGADALLGARDQAFVCKSQNCHDSLPTC